MSKKNELWLKVIQNVARIETDLGKFLQTQHSLGLSEYRALEILSQSENHELRMQDLAVQLGLNQSSVSRVVERLERSALTIRDVCSNDKRGVYSVLTEQGLDKLRSAQKGYLNVLEKGLKDSQLSQILTSIDK